MILEVPTFVFAATAYALVGVTLGLAYRTFPALRDEPLVHLGTVLLSLTTCLPVLVPEMERGSLNISYSLGLQGFLFLAASLCHLPVLVYIGLYHWNRLLERLTSPARRHTRRRRRLNSREEWRLVQLHLQALAENPLDVHHRERLAEAYLRLGFIDSAVGEYRKAIECMERGYSQARLLFKASRVLVDRKGNTVRAIPLLRRLIRLYPRSYFAAYARRVVNQYDAHQTSPTGGGPKVR